MELGLCRSPAKPATCPGSEALIPAFICYSLQSCLKEEHFRARFLKRYLVGDMEVASGSSKLLHVCPTAVPAMHLAHLQTHGQGMAASPRRDGRSAEPGWSPLLSLPGDTRLPPSPLAWQVPLWPGCWK